jgi:xanthine/uracil permease
MGSCLSSLVFFKTAAVASMTAAFLASRVEATGALCALAFLTNAPGRTTARIKITASGAAVRSLICFDISYLSLL